LQTAKSFNIAKQLVFEAYKEVKANKGSAGIDDESIEDFERDLKNNLYKLWNRLSSGTYFPSAVKTVAIPKKDGGTRILGIPTVTDRVAQMVVKKVLEPRLDPIFVEDSYGYRSGKSAHDAIKVTRKRCWQYDWVVEFDIKGLFDNIDHSMLLKALYKHCNCKWILLYVKRWLSAPIQQTDGTIQAREKGTPQGGVISPLLANLFLHYAFDVWVKRELPGIKFCRYADDGLLHFDSYQQASYILNCITDRFKACGLELHQKKSKIIYCKDANRKEEYKDISFDFLGYTFRPRRCIDKLGRLHPNFLPAISKTSKKAINRSIRSWHIPLKNDKSIAELAKMFNPILVGWYNYYGLFYSSALQYVWFNFNRYLIQWIRRKFKRFARHKRRAYEYLQSLIRANPSLFIHWKLIRGN
jgi:RNA-directed DNA polymerase